MQIVSTKLQRASAGFDGRGHCQPMRIISAVTTLTKQGLIVEYDNFQLSL